MVWYYGLYGYGKMRGLGDSVYGIPSALIDRATVIFGRGLRWFGGGLLVGEEVEVGSGLYEIV